MGIQDSMNSHKLLQGCFSKWHNRWAARMDAVAMHLARERQQHLGMNISIGGEEDEAVANPSLSHTAYAQSLGIPQAPPETDTSVLNNNREAQEYYYSSDVPHHRQYQTNDTRRPVQHDHHNYQNQSLWALNTTGITSAPSQLNSSCHLCGSAVTATDSHNRSVGGKKPKKTSRRAKSGAVSRPISRGASMKTKRSTVKPPVSTTTSNGTAASPKTAVRTPFR